MKRLTKTTRVELDREAYDEGLEITATLSEFCAQHHHRMPGQYWRDPMSRARDYVARFRPPWS
ncbi:hypothetical protein GCM10009623_32650 [Nocardioides aestuarii]|uniref:Uncharacterized protein n=1 Tax=Nocardioides aestuarii TaxID=252231 RepID=A0ABW4TPC4_9ACTN